MSKVLAVSLPGAPVGKLEQTRGGMTAWQPDPSWEEGNQHPRLGLDFLRTRGSRQAASELPAWFENLLPERESALRVRLCAWHELREGQSFELLRAVGRDLPGAVVVEQRGPESDAQVTELTHGPGENDAPDSKRRMSSLAGVQLKFSMSMVDDRLTLMARAGGDEWIVKFAGSDYPELAEVETATMTWAKRAGFDVPHHLTVPFEKLDGIPEGWTNGIEPVFAIRRFDRRADGSRVHHEDLCQALGLRPSKKYGETAPAVRFEGAVRLVTDVCGESGGIEMLRRIGFMIASGNSDAHLKNWGLLWGEMVRPTLVPCYDLVATISWEKLGWARKGGPVIALHIGGRHRFADLDRDAVEAFTGSLQYPWASEALAEGLERARDAFREIDVPIPARMREALEVHWSRVPVLRHLGNLPRRED